MPFPKSFSRNFFFFLSFHLGTSHLTFLIHSPEREKREHIDGERERKIKMRMEKEEKRDVKAE